MYLYCRVRRETTGMTENNFSPRRYGNGYIFWSTLMSASNDECSTSECIYYKSKSCSGGGITCCVPKTRKLKNSKRDKHLPFYVIPRIWTAFKETFCLLKLAVRTLVRHLHVVSVLLTLKEEWKHYMNNRPTIGPKTVQSKIAKERVDRSWRSSTTRNIWRLWQCTGCYMAYYITLIREPWRAPHP